MSLYDIVRSVTSRAGVVRVRNALNPILWTCAVASPLCFSFAYLFGTDPILRYGLSGLGALPIFAAITGYLHFMLRDPNRLQSEEFVLRQQELTIIERKSGLPISLDAETSEDLPIAMKRRSPSTREELD